MHSLLRYLRLFLAFGRFSLLGEMAFRGNALVKIVVELLWLGILLVFYDTVFSYTSAVATCRVRPRYSKLLSPAVR